MFIKDRAKTTTPDREALSGVVLPMLGFSRRSRCTVCGPRRLAGAYVFLAAGNRYAKACQNRLCQTLLTGVASGPVSRVLLSTAIYLDAPLPVRSSHLHGTAGPAICPSAVLLRIEFTAPHCLQPASELLPHFSTLTRSLGRFVSVALVRGSPLAGVTRYPCPAEPGLSSRTAFRLVPAAVRLTRPTILHILPRYVKRCGDLFSCNRVKWAV